MSIFESNTISLTAAFFIFTSRILSYPNFTPGILQPTKTFTHWILSYPKLTLGTLPPTGTLLSIPSIHLVASLQSITLILVCLGCLGPPNFVVYSTACINNDCSPLSSVRILIALPSLGTVIVVLFADHLMALLPHLSRQSSIPYCIPQFH